LEIILITSETTARAIDIGVGVASSTSKVVVSLGKAALTKAGMFGAGVLRDRILQFHDIYK
jgi:hypothetical protein